MRVNRECLEKGEVREKGSEGHVSEEADKADVERLGRGLGAGGTRVVFLTAWVRLECEPNEG